MTSQKAVIAWAVAAILYMVLLYTPIAGLTLAPIIAGMVVGLAGLTPRVAAGVGLLSGATGYAGALAATGGVVGLSLITGIGGVMVLAIVVVYHLVTPGLVSYIVSVIVRKK